MESVLGRYRNLIILVGVLFLQVLGLAVQVKRSGDAEHTRLIRIWAVSAITPLERGVVWVQNGTRNVWHNYFFLRGVRAENRQLKQQIEQMRLEQVRLSEDAAQAHRLQALLTFKEQFVSKTVAAQVIGSSGSDSSRILYIDKGENDGLARDMAVVTADGIVGKVLQVFPSVSQVLLINDQSSGVGAILEKSRLQGVLKGTANGEVVLERLMSDEQVEPGETVLTSGGDQIFPKGLHVGTVAHVAGGKGLFLSIRIHPAANLSRLEEVLVVTEKQEHQAAAEDSVRMRAADILAQRLPSVPDKPATAEINGAVGSSSGAANATLAEGDGAVKPPLKPVAAPQARDVTDTPKTNGTKPTNGIAAGEKATGGGSKPAVSAPAGIIGTSKNVVAAKSADTTLAKPPSATATKPSVIRTANPTDPKPASAAGSKPVVSQTKPAATPKPAPPQSNSQAPASQDGPH